MNDLTRNDCIGLALVAMGLLAVGFDVDGGGVVLTIGLLITIFG